ncbi:MAG: DUF6636 domain-containing protein [Aestuariivirga sp.]
MTKLRLTFFSLAMTISGVTAFADDGPTFMTPSGNIACQIQTDPSDRIYCVRRDPAQSTDNVPYLSAFLSMGKGKAAETGEYEGDAWYPDGALILAYGKSISARGITCTSRESGLTCKCGEHGFSVSQKAVKVY